MAGSTTNIGLIKPTYSEDADVAIINENMDTLDSTISALDNGLAIVSNNNTHGAITAGQYVYVRNHGSLAEGMYTANSNIAANATLSSSNLTAVTGGGLNDLAGDISALNNKISALGTGSNYIGDVICAGYNSGSGNYAELFIPINTNGRTVTAVTATSDSAIFLPSDRVLFSNTPTITVVNTLKNGVRIEIQYSTTKTSNVCISALFTSVTLTCS